MILAFNTFYCAMFTFLVFQNFLSSFCIYTFEQVCLTLGWSSVVFALCLLIEKIANSDPKVTYSYPRVTYSEPKVTYSDPKVTHSDPTHLPLSPPASFYHSLTIS